MPLTVWTPLVRCIPNLWHRVGDRLCSPPSLQEHHRPCPLTMRPLDRSMLEPRNLLPAMEQGRDGFLQRRPVAPAVPSRHTRPTPSCRPLAATRLFVRCRAMELRRGRTKELRRGHARSSTGQAKTQDRPRPPKTRRRLPSNPSRQSSLKSQVRARERLAQSCVGNRATGESCLG
jgi:hypothetical protein